MSSPDSSATLPSSSRMSFPEAGQRPSPDARSLVVAVDIGGTFTDVTLQDPSSGRAWRAKTPSLPSDPSQAFLTGVRLALEEAACQPQEVGRVLHGTTVATNMILERKGARAALVTTAGFRHVLEIGRQDIPRRVNLYSWVKPKRPVPASRILEVRERIGVGGVVLEELDEASVATAIESLRKLEVEAVAVCLLHAFANPAHEQRVAELLRAALPDVAVTASTDVLPVVREYERSLTTILNASVMPGIASYVGHLEERLADAKITAPLLLMQSNGGVAGARTIRRAPALTVLSGPAAGVVGARDVAAACGFGDIITVDIGGTSADITLIKGGEISLTQHGQVGEWPLSLPMVDMVTIGAGGGSIANVTKGTLTVGPRSAGAQPGPACYGRGGTEATVTDAHVVLGQLPESLLAGRMALERSLAETAIRKGVAEPLGLTIEEAARGMLAIIDSNMVGAIRVVSVERGHDPRDFTLVAFGGAGPLHGCSLSALLGIEKVLIPPAPGVLCAEGLLAADLKAEFSRTLAKSGRIDEVVVTRLYAELAEDAKSWFEEEGVALADRREQRVALLRYHGQGSELAVCWAGDATSTEVQFSKAHSALYGFTLDAAIELVTLRIEASGRMPAPVREKLGRARGAKAIATRRVRFAEGLRDVPVFDREKFGAGDSFTGPAIITQLDATTLIPPGWEGEVHVSGSLLLARE